jgi:hypothetical protein
VNTANSIHHPRAFELQEKIASLQAALLESHPQMPVLLRTIHTQLRTDPELVTLLSEDEIGIVVASLTRVAAVEIATAAPKAASSEKLALKKKLSGPNAVDMF